MVNLRDMSRRVLIRRQILAIIMLFLIGLGVWANDQSTVQPVPVSPELNSQLFDNHTAAETLDSLEVKGRAPKTGYSRGQFGDGWATISGCSTREIILARDLTSTVIDDKCRVHSGILTDPYTGININFKRGSDTSALVQIDHIVALSDAWQKGAQALDFVTREKLANDPLNLLAVDGAINQQKSDGDAATWLPPNKAFRCQYVYRQIAVKNKYSLWVTEPEKTAMLGVISQCQPQA